MHACVTVLADSKGRYQYFSCKDKFRLDKLIGLGYPVIDGNDYTYPFGVN